jgi:hypothetical protein
MIIVVAIVVISRSLTPFPISNYEQLHTLLDTLIKPEGQRVESKNLFNVKNALSFLILN